MLDKNNIVTKTVSFSLNCLFKKTVVGKSNQECNTRVVCIRIKPFGKINVC